MPPETAAWVARTPYRELVGSLNYIAVATRPDIAYAAGHLASFLDCYRPEDWTAAIRVLGYLKGTRALFLVLGGTNPLTLVGYSIQVRGFVVGLQILAKHNAAIQATVCRIFSCTWDPRVKFSPR